MKSLLLVAPLVLAVLGLVGCCTLLGTPSDQVPSGGILRSKKPRVTSPDVAAADLAELVAGNSAFAFDLYQTIRGEEGNLFLSPYSISLALAMTYAGARGDTEQQMADTLHYSLPQGRLHPAFDALDLELASRAEGAEGQDGRFRLNIANSIWGQTGYSFLAQFLDVLAQNYGAGLRVLDFVNEPEDSRVTINDWVSDETEAKIEDVLPPNSITPSSVLVLTNAIYFNAAWLHPFDEEVTHDGKFNLLDGDQVTVPMMEQTAYFGYAEGEGYQAVELAYDGQELSMIILLPEAGRFEEFTSALDSEAAALILTDVTPQEVHLSMPRFTYESGFSLKETLAAMGMPAAFARADFSGMDGTRSLFIDDVFHKAFVAVDEAGTEAAAATAVVVARAAFIRPKELTVDRPFVFMIRDIDTEAILFLGHVVNPSG
ncbi:MAG: serpin family protein [Anaerolineae bacterium]|nr:serpin family protein [Anaerolineae bacterium]NIN94092.1 serpin family protein [Anaerolineae bacterium]NIQ77140.1 serpin family protein [Anaerolineae bacterium]